jgi:hypothetical protein
MKPPHSRALRILAARLATTDARGHEHTQSLRHGSPAGFGFCALSPVSGPERERSEALCPSSSCFRARVCAVWSARARRSRDAAAPSGWCLRLRCGGGRWARCNEPAAATNLDLQPEGLADKRQHHAPPGLRRGLVHVLQHRLPDWLRVHRQGTCGCGLRRGPSQQQLRRLRVVDGTDAERSEAADLEHQGQVRTWRVDQVQSVASAGPLQAAGPLWDVLGA